MNKGNRKIAIISISLSGGGAERFGGLLSKMLSGLGFEIHNIIINDAVDFDYSGTLFNLGAATKNQSGVLRKINKGLLLKRYLDENNIDCIIDNRSRNVFLREWFAKKIFGKRDVISIVHSARLENYFPKSRFLAQLLYSDSKTLVCVSKAIEGKVIGRYDFRNTVTIYNPIAISAVSTEKDSHARNYILFFGRLDDKVKNFNLMIEAFSKSHIANEGYRLLIMGDGPDRKIINALVDRYKLNEKVEIVPFRKDPYPMVKSAYFTILSSRYEGFPMSIAESLALGTPVISVDCESGPSEMIKNESNGLIVPNHNVTALADAMSRFVNEPKLYDICKANAQSSVRHLSIENISKQWQQILSRP